MVGLFPILASVKLRSNSSQLNYTAINSAGDQNPALSLDRYYNTIC